MAEAGKDQDQSMEEILQSIKRIIADEGDPAPVSNSEVLELTDMIVAEEAAAPNAIPAMSIDEIMAAPVSSVPAEPEFIPTPPAPEPLPEPIAIADEGLISEATRVASAAALDALRHTPAEPHMPVMSHSFRSGTTVEDLVIETLRPMLREWLDTHLTGIVERLVEREVRRVSGR
jgi:uncharacterized protein